MKIGDRVYYVSGKHGCTPNNPLKGSEYECQGTIKEISTWSTSIVIRWDNGASNGYNESDLRIASVGPYDPNKVFRAKKHGERKNG